MKKYERVDWPKGEWDNEPDRIEWRLGDVYCLVNRVMSETYSPGHLCGYIGVQESHQWYSKHYDDIDLLDEFQVHWGLTFSNKWKGDEGVPSHLWLLGFDCAHCDDVQPGTLALTGRLASGDEEYRNVEYVVKQVLTLAMAAKAPLTTLRWVQVIDGDTVQLTVAGGRKVMATGDGADLLKRWVRFGDSHLGVAADWFEDHPESIAELKTKDVTVVANHMRRLVGC